MSISIIKYLISNIIFKISPFLPITFKEELKICIYLNILRLKILIIREFVHENLFGTIVTTKEWKPIAIKVQEIQVAYKLSQNCRDYNFD